MRIETGTTAAVVTGGASGLGRATAEALADAGAKVAIFDINEEAGRDVADEIGGIFCRVNILDEQSAVDGFAEAREAHGQERILVHCAMTPKGGKTVGNDRETGGFKRLSTEDYAFATEGILDVELPDGVTVGARDVSSRSNRWRTTSAARSC